MNKKVLAGLICSVLLLSCTAAHGGEKPYLSGHLGFAAPDDSETEFDSGPKADFELDEDFALTAALGKRFNKNYRFEIELSNQKNDIDRANIPGTGEVDINGDVESLALMANIYYDFINKTSFTPFLSAGVGYAKIDLSDITLPGTGIYLENDDDYVLAYQFGGGLGYDINKHITLDLKYRYFSTADPEFGIAESEFVSHNYYLGIRFTF